VKEKAKKKKVQLWVRVQNIHKIINTVSYCCYQQGQRTSVKILYTQSLVLNKDNTSTLTAGIIASLQKKTITNHISFWATTFKSTEIPVALNCFSVLLHFQIK